MSSSPRVAAQRRQIDSIRQGAAIGRQERETPTNNRGLPGPLKNGLESLSGMSMDHVVVHYNSSRPAGLGAHAYAQGSEIHLAPGQERHLPHEAWHVVQQARGRVRPTMQMTSDVPINDDAGLESEADLMGARALADGPAVANFEPPPGGHAQPNGRYVAQRKVGFEFETTGEVWAMQGKQTADSGWTRITHTKKPLLANAALKIYLSADNGHTEFVTNPLVSMGEVTAAITGLFDWYSRLLPRDPTNYLFSEAENLAAAAHTGLVAHRIALIGPAQSKPQATLGVSISDLLQFYGDMLALKNTMVDEPASRRAGQDERDRIERQAFTKGIGHDGNLKNIEASRRFAEGFVADLTYLKTPSVIAEVRGFAMLVEKTFLDSRDTGQLPDPKTAFPLLPRVSFRNMYLSLSAEAREVLENNMCDVNITHWGMNTEHKQSDRSFPRGAQQVSGGEHRQGPRYDQWLESIYETATVSDRMTMFANNERTDTSTYEGFGALAMDGAMTLLEMRQLFQNVDKTISPDEWLNLAVAVAGLALKYNK
jgi:hypothetical protein